MLEDGLTRVENANVSLLEVERHTLSLKLAKDGYCHEKIRIHHMPRRMHGV